MLDMVRVVFSIYEEEVSFESSSVCAVKDDLSSNQNAC